VTDSTPNPIRSLCFVSFDAVVLVYPDAKGSIGGAETQVVLMAKALSAAPDVRVTVVVRDSKSRPTQIVDRFHVVTFVDRLFRIRRFVSEHVTISRRFPWLRIRKWSRHLFWQLPLLFAAHVAGNTSTSNLHFDWLNELADSDVYCCTGASDRTADVFDAAKKHNRKTVMFVVSDADVDERYLTVPGFFTKYGDSGSRCADAIKNADLIACQTDVQRQMLRDRFGKDSILFPNPFDHIAWSKSLEQTHDLPEDVKTLPPRFALWIGRSERHHKRPELLLQVARQCPGVPFVMVMNTQDEAVAEAVRQQKPENVRIIERVSFHLMPHLFSRSAMFISTGSREFEGFPNVFLQAAASSVPVVSLEADPGFVTEHQTGIVCHGDLDRLAASVQTAWNDREQADRMGQNGRLYVIGHHSIADTRQRLIDILNSFGEERILG
jgi:glycosyltransferase involved in cell wall biosynthesis